jgi:hypothetical protein
MKKYKFILDVYEGNDEFWESIVGTGCPEVEELVRQGLASFGLSTDYDCSLQLVTYENMKD